MEAGVCCSLHLELNQDRNPSGFCFLLLSSSFKASVPVPFLLSPPPFLYSDWRTAMACSERGVRGGGGEKVTGYTMDGHATFTHRFLGDIWNLKKKNAKLPFLYAHPFCTIKSNILYLLSKLNEKFCGRNYVFQGNILWRIFLFLPEGVTWPTVRSESQCGQIEIG